MRRENDEHRLCCLLISCSSNRHIKFARLIEAIRKISKISLFPWKPTCDKVNFLSGSTDHGVKRGLWVNWKKEEKEQWWERTAFVKRNNGPTQSNHRNYSFGVGPGGCFFIRPFTPPTLQALSQSPDGNPLKDSDCSFLNYFKISSPVRDFRPKILVTQTGEDCSERFALVMIYIGI